MRTICGDGFFNDAEERSHVFTRRDGWPADEMDSPEAMSLLYIFAASTMEGKSVRKLAVPANSNSPFRCGANDLVLIISGIGPRSAKNKAELALRDALDASALNHNPDAVLVIGLCGGLTASLPEGRIVAYTECLSTEATSAPLRSSKTIADSFVALLRSANIPCDPVAGITSSRFATTRDERLALAKVGATVVDMESYSILEAAATAGIPAAVLRVVSDSIKRSLPDFNRALNDSGGLDGRRALQVALGSPLRTGRLLFANRRALARLNKALEIVLGAPYFG